MVDLENFRKFCGNDTGFMLDLLDTIRLAVPGLIQEMTLAIQQKDWEAYRGASHKLKPTAKLLGLNAFVDQLAKNHERAQYQQELHVLESFTKQLSSLDADLPHMIEYIKTQLKSEK